MLQQERDQQSPDAAVPVEIGVDSLELNVHQSGAYERGQPVVAMDVLLDIAEQPAEFMRWRRHESGVAGPCAADPILAPSDLARLPARAAAALHQPAMGLVQQPHRERQALWTFQLAARVGEGVYIVADFLDVVGRRRRSAAIGTCLERQ